MQAIEMDLFWQIDRFNLEKEVGEVNTQFILEMSKEGLNFNDIKHILLDYGF